MALSTITSWSGGSLGTSPTTTTEPNFSAQGGTEGNALYSAAIGGEAGQAVRVTSTRDFTRTVTGTHWRVGVRVARVSGTQTAGQACLLFRNGVTNVGDIFLRNQNGGQFALRQGVGGAIYAGQSTTTTTNGESPWRLEVEYQSDGALTHSITLYLFEPGNLTSTPDDIFSGTVVSPIDNFRILNPTGSTGLTLDFGAVLFEDTGAPIWATGDTPGTLTFLSNVFASQDEIVFVGKVADATTVEVTGGTSSPVSPDADGYFRAVLTGLTPGTEVAWDVLVDAASARTGTTTTLPSFAGDMTFLWGSCFDVNTSGFFSLADARTPAFIVGLGDHGYQYITGGPNGNTSPTDVSTCRLHREPVLAAAAPQALFTKYSYSQTFSDCDGGGANSDSTTGGLATGAVQAAHRQQFAHPTLPLANSAARSWVVGRVRFVQTDETAAASAKGATDDSAKTKLGAEQKAWFKGEIDSAVASGQAVVWLGDGPWLEPASLTGNSWRAYNTERTELGAYIQASGVKIVRLHGDTHTLFADDGTNNSWGGFPTASAAPWHTTAQPYTFPVSDGTWPTATTNSSRQYGVGTFTDAFSTLTLNIKGYSSTNAAPTEVERYSMDIDLTPTSSTNQPWDSVYLGGDPVDAVYVGDVQIWP